MGLQVGTNPALTRPIANTYIPSNPKLDLVMSEGIDPNSKLSELGK